MCTVGGCISGVVDRGAYGDSLLIDSQSRWEMAYAIVKSSNADEFSTRACLK